MNSTNYIIELLIAGVCNFIWVTLLLLALFCAYLPLDLSFLEKMGTIWVGLALAPLIYVFGVINDRVVDYLFDRTSKLRLAAFPDIRDYHQARSAIYIHSETLTKLYEYGRVRIRICRNWTLNGMLILFSGLIFIWSKPYLIENEGIRIQLTIVAILLIGGSVVLAYFAWVNLNQKEFQFLKVQKEFFLPPPTKEPEKAHRPTAEKDGPPQADPSKS